MVQATVQSDIPPNGQLSSQDDEDDAGRIRRWLQGLAEATVRANGGRATFVSDMYFEAAEAIERLERNLNGRDKFIGERGLWMDFVDQLPNEPKSSPASKPL